MGVRKVRQDIAREITGRAAALSGRLPHKKVRGEKRDKALGEVSWENEKSDIHLGRFSCAACLQRGRLSLK